MKAYARQICTVLGIIIFLLSAPNAMAETWEYGTSGKGKNPFTPRGYVIVTENGKFWLNSRFDNTGTNVSYSGVKNGVDYIEAKKTDGSNYTLYAFTDRNPKIYKMLCAYENGKLIRDFSSYIQAPGRLAENETLGSGAGWAIPIEGFEFEPGCYYEFAFYRGMQANNGITLVFSEDGKGYIKNPETAEEKAKYERDKYEEYKFMSSYWVVRDPVTNEYTYDFHLVPMRFSVQTYADTSTWTEGRKEAQAFIAKLKPSDISEGRYVQSNINNLISKLKELDEEVQKKVRKMLQKDAETTISLMIVELKIALKKAQQPKSANADLSELKALLKEARVLYKEASSKIGAGIGQYGADATAKLKVSIDYAASLNEFNTQKEINEAAIELRESLTRVYASIIHEESLILSDYATGIKLVIPADAVPSNTVLYVNKPAEDSELYQSVAAAMPSDTERFILYDIKLYTHDLLTEPTRKFRMHLPIPADSSNSRVYTIGEDNLPSTLTSAQTDGYKILSARNTGLFAVAYTPKSAEEDVPPEVNDPKNTVTVSKVEQTDVDIKDVPDENLEDIDQTSGHSDKAETPGFDEPRSLTTAIPPVRIPLEELSREGNPFFIPIASGILLIVAIIIFLSFILNQGKRKKGFR